MLQNAYFLAKIGADTAENEQHFAEILPKTGTYSTGPRAAARAPRAARGGGARRGPALPGQSSSLPGGVNGARLIRRIVR